MAVVIVFLVAAELQPSSGRWRRVERRDLVIGAAVEGELQAVNSVELGPPQMRELSSFKISFLAPEGAAVSEGTPVIGFDTTELQQNLQEEIAERDSAQKELEKATTDFEKSQRDLELRLAVAHSELRKDALKLAVPGELVAGAELEKARIDRRLNELEVHSLESTLEHTRVATRAKLDGMRRRRDRAATRVEELEAQIQQMTIVAPRAGTIIYKTNWRGEKKKVGDSTWRTEKVLEIPDLRQMQAHGQVDEADAGRIAGKQRVTLRLEAHPDVQYDGVVRSVHRSVQQLSWRDPAKVVRLEIGLDETDEERMRPGMRFRGRVIAELVPEVLVVPQEAVTLRPEGPAVTVRGLFRQRRVYPTLGRRNQEHFEVLDGLDEGDRVLLRGRDEAAP